MIEAGILLVVGILFGWFVFSGEYWRLLNPKFQWLTAGSAICMVLIALAGFRYPRRPTKGTRLLILLSLVGLLFLEESDTRVAGSTDEIRSPGSRILMDGTEYIKINIGELHFLLTIPTSDEKKGPGVDQGHYVLRGVVKHHPDLEKAGQLMLMRAVVWCCLADAAGTGFRVFTDQLKDFKDGEWVQVFGRLKPLNPTPEPVFIRFDKTLVMWANKDYAIIPDKIIRISPPEKPFVFNRETKEPFNY
jgi:hypothetical protein